MVDSRQKGARAESQVKELLERITDLNWQRIPLSGALDARHGLKGDLYIPNEINLYCVEVKHYKDDHISSALLTSKKSQLETWWEQTLRQGFEVEKKPLLFFKYDRSKTFVATLTKPQFNSNYIFHNKLEIYIMLAEDWLLLEEIFFTL